jgi:hypothetical protein
VTVRRALTWLAVLVTAITLAVVARPADRTAEIRAAQELGYRASRRAAFRRNLARVAAESLHAAKARSDSTYAHETARLRRVAASALSGLEAHIDSTPRVIVGPASVSDSLVALPVARAALQALADSSLAAMERMRAAALQERGRASLVILNLEATVAAQDTVIQAKTAELAAVRKERPNLFRRAAGGVTHLLAGGACGAVGYIAAGPMIGAGAAVACSAIAGIVR